MKSRWMLIFLALVFTSSLGFAQWRRRRNMEGPIWYTEGRDGVPVDERTVQTAREVPSHSTDTPVWSNPPDFSRDVFTFCRIIRDRDPESSPTAGSWITDFPDSDLNLSYRVQQMTSIKVNPNGRTIRLTDKALFDYPFIYMVEVGSLLLRDEEVPILRKYLLNGGFLMVDDFWGDWQWDSFAAQMKRVFPEREFAEHPIFHSVFDLKGTKKDLQTPGEQIGVNAKYTGITWERHPHFPGEWREDWQQCTEMHVRALTDDKGRIMVLATHDCDNGDGWEREGEDDYFFHEFSEKRAFPLGINIIFYVMTH